MRSLRPLAVFVVAILSTVVSAAADDSAAANSVADSSLGVMPPVQSYGVNGYDSYRRTPDLGSPVSPGHGFKHFSSPLHAFTTWYRPRAATRTQGQRCAPDAFRPRGFGRLFARPCDPYRMEYTPFVLRDGQSAYGPAYLLRACDQRCEHCDRCDCQR